MKNKSGMAKLRKKIVITFILITFLSGSVNEILDLIFEVLEPFLLSGDGKALLAALPVMVVLNIANYIFCGLLFLGTGMYSVLF